MVEKVLRYSNVFRLLLIDSKWAKCFCSIKVKIFWNSRNQSDHSFFISFNIFDETQIVFINTTFNSYPLMFLKSLFLYNQAIFHNFGHFIDWNHLYRSHIYSAKSLEDFLHMLWLESFTKYHSLTKLRFKNFKYI